MSKNYIFSSESVGEGHPDKVCDTISDAVLDACLAQDKYSRVACETYAKSNLVVVGGEITTKARLDFNEIARAAIREIGYTHDDDVFHADKVLIMNAITSQSPDISQGVDAKAADGKDTAEQGAGDQGLMFGYACNETPELMPAPIMFAHQLGRELTRIRKSEKVKCARLWRAGGSQANRATGGVSCLIKRGEGTRRQKRGAAKSKPGNRGAREEVLGSARICVGEKIHETREGIKDIEKTCRCR